MLLLIYRKSIIVYNIYIIQIILRYYTSIKKKLYKYQNNLIKFRILFLIIVI
jgi:hypothetical protein